jgi:hypothetical protein
MPPTAIIETQSPADVVADLNTKVASAEEEKTALPALPDNYMYDFKYNHALPTIETLGCDIAADADATKEAEAITARLAEILSQGDMAAFTDLFLDYGVWRDKLAFTWDYRTFNFSENIARAAADLLPSTRATNVRLFTPVPSIERPYPDLSYLQFSVAFDTDLVTGSAMVNAVQTPEGWKIWTMHTVAEGLVQFPEVPPADGHMTGDISWEKQRAKDDDEIKPDVVIIGGGQK